MRLGRDLAVRRRPRDQHDGGACPVAAAGADTATPGAGAAAARRAPGHPERDGGQQRGRQQWSGAPGHRCPRGLVLSGRPGAIAAAPASHPASRTPPRRGRPCRDGSPVQDAGGRHRRATSWHWCTRMAGPAEPARRLVPLPRGADHADARRRRRHLPGARRAASTTTGWSSSSGDRIAFVPRYRQKIRWVPGRLANPVWVDDEDFDVTYHVRRSALPRPGTDAQLRELVARVQSRPLDRDPAAVGDVPRRGAVRRPVRASSPRPTTRWSTGSARSTSARSSSTPRPEPRDVDPQTPGARTRSRAGRAGRRRRRRDSCAARRPSSTPCARRRWTMPASAAGGWPDAAGGLLAAARHGVARPAPGEPAERRDRRAAPLRHGRARPRRLQAGSARRTAAPSTTSCSRPSPARCGPGC